ncbi:MAG: hypothetical protein Q9187_004204 [Circinaria calcarea]
MSSTSNFRPQSPPISLPDLSQSIFTPEQDFPDGDDDACFEGGDRLALYAADLELPDFEELKELESRRPWADAPDDWFNSSSPSMNQQFFSGSTDTGMFYKVLASKEEN